MRMLRDFLKIKNEPYSINQIEDIVEKIETMQLMTI